MTAIRKNKLQPIQEKVLNKLCSLFDEKELCENIEKGIFNYCIFKVDIYFKISSR